MNGGSQAPAEAESLRDAGALVLACFTVAVPMSVTVGTWLLWQRLDRVDVEPTAVLPRVGTQHLAITGAEVLTPVVISAVLALLIVALLVWWTAGTFPTIPILVTGLAFIALGVVIDRTKWDPGGAILDKARLAVPTAILVAVFGGAILLVWVLLLTRARRPNDDWKSYVAQGAVFVIATTIAACLYLQVFGVGPGSIRETSEVAVLLKNVRPEQHGMPRPRVQGALIYATSDAIGVLVICKKGRVDHRQVLELPRSRILWVRVPSEPLNPVPCRTRRPQQRPT